MSFITAFNFDAFSGDLRMRGAVHEKVEVSLSLMSAENVEQQAFVEVRTRAGHENKAAPWKPVVKNGIEYPTFWDTRMGNFEFKSFPTQSCTTCAASVSSSGNDNQKYGNQRCNGHFGYVSMPRLYPNDESQSAERMFVYNPHMHAELELLLQAECFYCHKFRAPAYDVERYKCALVLCDINLVGEALHLLEQVPNTRGQERLNKRRRDPSDLSVGDISALHRLVEHKIRTHGIDPEPVMAVLNGCPKRKLPNLHMERGAATLDIRSDIVKAALKELKEYPNSCTRCDAYSPRVTGRNWQFFFHFGKRAYLAHNINVAKVQDMAETMQWEVENKRHNRIRTYYSMARARKNIKALCGNEANVLAFLFPDLGGPTIHTVHDSALATKKIFRVFFLDRLPVPPMPLRLQSGVQVINGNMSADDRTKTLSDILAFSDQIEQFFLMAEETITTQQRIAHEDNLRNLQLKVNEAYTAVLDSFAKKEGLFRMHMMGKRVNQACRSVISPDFTVESNEVLVPRPFARNLSFPEPVTFHSTARTAFLKQCVINGPSVYPGATHIEIRKATGEITTVDLKISDDNRRKTAAKYFSLAQNGDTVVVYRHVITGDRLIFNRQPTLHKPSMQGYKARVLSGLKTLRFHYINAKSYNADFDGDEMNVHIPQSYECRAELDVIMDANHQYIAPTSGKPLRGLIQDHLSAGVHLTLRDRFFDAPSFIELAYIALQPYMGSHTTIDFTSLLPIPAILKPRPLFSGKQLITAILRFVTGCHRGGKGITIRGTSSIQPNIYSADKAAAIKKDLSMSDASLIVVDSCLLAGVLCKNQLGPSANSMVHLVYELCGPFATGQFFGALGRVLTAALQREGFSMGMDDMLLTAEDERIDLLDQLDVCSFNLPDPNDEAAAMGQIMDRATKLQKEFVPGKLLVPFPHNSLVAMTQSGAKGSNTNAIQMALGLGQQLFDGRRVKWMNSGKTLPGFFIGESRARSYGYAMGRFASGIRPPEYTIHAMAGRDGLIDTGVKTSRSGHLQRCLIKGLESLVVGWDKSVRDSNGAIVQFTYGGDGLDPCKSSMLNAYDIIRANVKDFGLKFRAPTVLDDVAKSAEVTRSEANSAKRSRMAAPDGTEAPNPFTPEGNRLIRNIQAASARDPLTPALTAGIAKYVDGHPNIMPFESSKRLDRWISKGADVAKEIRTRNDEWGAYYKHVIGEIVNNKRLRAVAEAGEPVGLLAAQAAGEPSTQMTLNTFHSAGATVSHVTEGIPRLRELLIYASVQKAAVLLPIQKAKADDFIAIQNIVNAAVPSRLEDVLAPCAPKNRMRYTMLRNEHNTILDVELLMSKELLNIVADKMQMATGEHVDSLREALKAFAKKVVAALRGRTRIGAEAAAAAALDELGEDDRSTRVAAQDPADLGGEAFADGPSGGRKGGRGRDDDDEEAYDHAREDDLEALDEDAVSESDVAEARAARRGAKSAAKKSAGSDDDDDASEAEDEDEDDNAITGNAVTSDDDSSSDVDAPIASSSAPAASSSGRKGAARNAVTHDTFSPIAAAYGGGKFTVEMVPKAFSEWLHENHVQRSAANIDPSNSSGMVSGIAELAKTGDASLFVVKMRFIMPPRIIAVVPDVLRDCLATVTFPTWLPQCEKARWTPSLDDASTGDLVFEGKGATLKNILLLVSLFSTNHGEGTSVRTDKIMSTDIHDMCRTFGVETGYRALMEELSKLFKRYAVDSRHMSLIADAATHKGVWESYNFTGIIARSSSPLFQMTFASSKKFLHQAVTRGVPDSLASISSAILVGEKPRVGTATASVAPDDRVVKGLLERAFS